MPAIVYSATAAFVVLLAAYGIHLIKDDGTSQLGIADHDDKKVERKSGFVLLIDALGIRTQQSLRRLYGPLHLKTLDRRLKNAGNPEGLTLDLFIQREAGFISLSILLIAVFSLLGHPIYGLAFGAIFSGWMYLWLAQALRNRQKKLNRDLPDFLDILAVTVRSGLPFRNALERVCEHFEGPVSEEMITALHEMRLGVSRRDAFTAVRKRGRSENIDTFVTALLQSEELGTPIGEALQAIVKEIRRERAEQVRRDAAKASPKVSFVATMTMLPGTIVLMIGGMLYANRDVFARIFGG